MRAQEVEPERVVMLRHRARFALLREPLLPRGACRIAAHLIEERTPRDRDEPRTDVAHALEHRSLEGAHEGGLHRILGRREVRAAPDEDADDLRDRSAQRRRIHRRHPTSAGTALITSRSSSHSPRGAPPAHGAADSSEAQLQRALVRVDLDQHPPGDEVLRLGERTVDDGRAPLAVEAHPRAAHRERLRRDQLPRRR